MAEAARYLSAGEFATAAGITDRAARAALSRAQQGLPWRATNLSVVRTPGGLVLDEASLPAELRSAPSADHKDALQRALEDQVGPSAIATGRWRYSVIRDAVAAEAGSQARSNAVAAAAATYHIRGDERITLAPATLYDWIARYERDGIVGLIPSARADRNRRRVKVGRRWDGEIDLPADAIDRIAEAIRTYGRSLQRKKVSYRRTAELASSRLYELSLEAGSKHPELRRLCRLGETWVREFREHRRLARRETDAKLYDDKDQPRLRRLAAERPMDVVWGDVHPVDILVRDANGKDQVRVRLIAWQDDATHFLWAYRWWVSLKSESSRAREAGFARPLRWHYLTTMAQDYDLRVYPRDNSGKAGRHEWVVYRGDEVVLSGEIEGSEAAAKSLGLSAIKKLRDDDLRATRPRPRDANQLAKFIVDEATGEEPEHPDTSGQRKGGWKGGKAKARSLTPDQRSEAAQIAAAARWKKSED